MTGRPHKLTPQRRNVILAHIRLGHYDNEAAEGAGIHPDTLKNWKKRGAQAFDTATQIEDDDGEVIYAAAHPDDQPFLDLFTALTRARVEAEGFYLNINRKAAAGGELIEEREYTRQDGTNVVIRRFTAPDARAAQWYLSRKFPDRWGQRETDKAFDELDDQHPVQLWHDELAELRRQRDAARGGE